jgi:hypothetical protein
LHGAGPRHLCDPPRRGRPVTMHNSGLTLSLSLLVSSSVVMGVGATETVTYSRLNWKPCASSDDMQQFHLNQKTGKWTDKATGRCLSVLDKQQPPGEGTFGKVVLDTCDGPAYTGSPSGQKWSADPASGLQSGTAIDVHSPISPSTWCINTPLSDCELSKQCFGGFNIVTYMACGSPNSMMKFTAKGQVVLSDGFFKDKCLTQEPCNSESSPPCALPSGWGGPFLIAVAVASVLYLAGGVAYAKKVQGRDVTLTTAVASHPHHALWLSLGGLVADGVLFSRERVKAWRAGGQGYSTVPAATTAGAQPKAESDGRTDVAALVRQVKAEKTAAEAVAATAVTGGSPAAANADSDSDSDSGGGIVE